jgi:hypothetical protein
METALRRGELSALAIPPSPLRGGWPSSGRVGMVKVVCFVSTPSPVLLTDLSRKGEDKHPC